MKQDFPIYTIAFAHDEFKRTRMIKHLATLGLKTEFIDAVDGKAFTQSEVNSLTSKNRRYWSSHAFRPGSMGCAMSHYTAWQRLLDEGHDYCLVLEDDVYLDQKAPQIIPLSLQKLAKLDIASLYSFPLKRPREHVLGIDETYSWNVVKYNSVGTQAYFISKEAAFKLLQIARPPVFEVDVFMNRWWDHGVSLLTIEPGLTEIYDECSSIGYDAPPPPLEQESGLDVLIRRLLRLRDSFCKRARFSAYLKQGRRRVSDI